MTRSSRLFCSFDLYNLKYCLNYLSSLLATCSAKHSPLDFIAVLISYKEHDYELPCSGWRKLTKPSTFAYFCNLKREFNYTVANIFVPCTIKYVGILSPLSLSCLVYTNELPNWHKMIRHDHLIYIVQVLLSCLLNLQLECLMLFWESIFSGLKCLQNVLKNPIEL